MFFNKAKKIAQVDTPKVDENEASLQTIPEAPSTEVYTEEDNNLPNDIISEPKVDNNEALEAQEQPVDDVNDIDSEISSIQSQLAALKAQEAKIIAGKKAKIEAERLKQEAIKQQSQPTQSVTNDDLIVKAIAELHQRVTNIEATLFRGAR